MKPTEHLENGTFLTDMQASDLTMIIDDMISEGKVRGNAHSMIDQLKREGETPIVDGVIRITGCGDGFAYAAEFKNGTSATHEGFASSMDSLATDIALNAELYDILKPRRAGETRSWHDHDRSIERANSIYDEAHMPRYHVNLLIEAAGGDVDKLREHLVPGQYERTMTKIQNARIDALEDTVADLVSKMKTMMLSAKSE